MQNNNDVSPFIALVILALVLAGLFGLQNYSFVISNFDAIKIAILKSQNPLMLLGMSIILNLYVITMVAERSLGYKKQGSKLRSIKNEKFNFKDLFLRVSLSILGTAIFYQPISIYILENTISLKPFTGEYYLVLTKTVLISSCFSFSLLLFWVIGILGRFSRFFRGSRLPSLKEVDNHLTLGTVGEEVSNFEKKIDPKWAVIPQRALNGNILVTGSIGTGKTQGTILNYAEQLFGNNFHLTPSSLVLDPKGSFIPEIVNILKKRGTLGDCVYLGDAHGNI